MGINAKMTAIADAIREKTGKSALLSLDNMPFEIANIETSSLNFEVVGGTEQPTNPQENTIWVNTDTAITSYIFSTTKPTEPIEGMLWFETGTNSKGEFNAIIDNSMMVYPIQVEQYINGVWKPKDGFIYKESQWIQFAYTILWLYRDGDRNLDITGDYHRDGTDAIPPDGQTAEGVKYVDFPCRSNDNLYKAIQFYTGKMIDITGFNYLVEKSIHGRSGDSVQLVSSDKQVAAEVKQTLTSNEIQTLVLDISSFTGEYYIGFYNFNNGYDNWDMYELYLTTTETEDILNATNKAEV